MKIDNILDVIRDLMRRLEAIERTGIGAGGDTTPAGIVVPYAGSTAPGGYLMADGSAVSRTTYADLFTAIGTTYGAGDGSTTFNLPNLAGRVPVGLDSTDTDFDALNETGGEKEHTLTEAEMPSHTHAQDPHRHSISIYRNGSGSTGNPGMRDGGTDYTNYTTATNQNTGGDDPHNNLQPYITLNYIIKT